MCLFVVVVWSNSGKSSCVQCNTPSIRCSPIKLRTPSYSHVAAPPAVWGALSTSSVGAPARFATRSTQRKECRFCRTCLYRGWYKRSCWRRRPRWIRPRRRKSRRSKGRKLFRTNSRKLRWANRNRLCLTHWTLSIMMRRRSKLLGSSRKWTRSRKLLMELNIHCCSTRVILKLDLSLLKLQAINFCCMQLELMNGLWVKKLKVKYLQQSPIKWRSSS